MIQRKACVAALLLCICSMCAFTLEKTKGKIRLVLHENLGRFSLYYLQDDLKDPAKKKYVSFFLDQDVKTSVISIVVDNKIHRLGESANFTETINETPNGARFVWKSSQIEITEDFTFITSPGEKEADGIAITFGIKNISKTRISTGVRFLFDTFLGETQLNHFKTSTGTFLSVENVFEKNNMIGYWISPDAASPDIGLMMITNGSGCTTPDRVIFANWKRLNESAWTYLSSVDRDFNARPYSINDSAVCQYYDPFPLEPQASGQIVLKLLNVNEDIFKITDSDTGSMDKPDDEQEAKIKSDIEILKNILAAINKKIKSNEKITDRDIALMEQIIEEIKSHLKEYSE